MDRAILESSMDRNENYILPFLWMKGEDEETIRREMDRIDACGIKAVCLESRPHPDYAGPSWWRDFDIVLDEAKKRGMKIWILDDAHFPTGLANGLLPKKYPERAKQYLSVKIFDVTGPKARVSLDIASSMRKAFTWMDIGKPVERPLIDEQKLVSIVAVRLVEDDTVMADKAAGDEEVARGAVRGSLINRMVLSDVVRDGKLTADFPAGTWRVFVVHTTYDEGARNDYINIIDEDSVKVLIEAVYEPHYARYKEEFGRTIAGFFSDEPGFGNTFGFEMNESIGRKEMPLPWNREVPGMLEERLGPNWRELLPLLFYPSEDGGKTAEVRYAYMDVVSQLYARHFSMQLGEWCRERGVEYIGHVIEDKNAHSRLGCGAGHFFRALSGQSMAGFDNIGGQILPGNPNTIRHGFNSSDGKFYHYMEAKMAASVALLQEEKKGKLMCETFGAYGWGFGVRDMKWVADWLLSRGVNHFVPHAFSMDRYPDTDCPPHFYAHGKNPEYPYFAHLMRYVNRLCHVFSGGKWIPEVAILYHGDMEWMDDCMMDQVPAQKLSEGHIDYAIVPSDALLDASGVGIGRYGAKVRDGRLYVNGVPLKLIIVPRAKYLDPKLAAFMQENPEIPVLFVDELPEAAFRVVREGVALKETEMEHIKNILASALVVALNELVQTIRSMGVIGARADVKGDVTFFHYVKDSGDLWMAFNESLTETVHGDLLVKVGEEDKKVYRYNAMLNRICPVEQIPAFGFDEPRMLCTLELEPYESAVFFTASPDEVSGLVCDRDPEERRDITRMDISSGWSVELAFSADEPLFRPIEDVIADLREKAARGCPDAEAEDMPPKLPEPARDAGELAASMGDELRPVSDILPTFSGFMRYERDVWIENPSKPFVIEAENFYEVGRIFVNGEETDFRLCPPYRFDLGKVLKKGINRVVIEAANTPQRDVLNYDQGMFGHEKGFYEPSGMFGKVTLVETD